MFSLGITEVAILVGIGTIGVVAAAALYFIVRAAVRSGNRESANRSTQEQ